MKSRPAMLAVLAAITLASGVCQADVGAEWRRLAAGQVEQYAAGAAARDAVLDKVAQAVARAAASGNGNGNGHGNGANASERTDAAIAVATFAVLERLVPQSREELESRLAVTFSRISETDAKAQGAALGRRIAREVLGD